MGAEAVLEEKQAENSSELIKISSYRIKTFSDTKAA